jgi:hypothetical protein
MRRLSCGATTRQRARIYRISAKSSSERSFPDDLLSRSKRKSASSRSSRSTGQSLRGRTVPRSARSYGCRQRIYRGTWGKSWTIWRLRSNGISRSTYVGPKKAWRSISTKCIVFAGQTIDCRIRCFPKASPRSSRFQIIGRFTGRRSIGSQKLSRSRSCGKMER